MADSFPNTSHSDLAVDDSLSPITYVLFLAEKNGSYKGHTGTLYKCVDVAKRKDLNWREYRAAPGTQGRGKREIPEKTRRPGASPGMIPICAKTWQRPRWESNTGFAPGFSRVVIVPLGGDGFSRASPVSRPFVPVLLHTHLTSPSSALKTSMLRAAQITPLFVMVPSSNCDRSKKKKKRRHYIYQYITDARRYTYRHVYFPLINGANIDVLMAIVVHHGTQFPGVTIQSHTDPLLVLKVQKPPLQNDLGSIPVRVIPDFRMWESCRDDAVGRWVFVGDLPLLPSFHSSAALYSLSPRLRRINTTSVKQVTMRAPSLECKRASFPLAKLEATPKVLG
ncbi:hypothetical protein PR048_003643 [Dryococelus australis]|uniref:Uncharacterized protein n=1 Tax=Dryococelus australis TaxID=614101 RepID=A0ABQ9IQG3_9NEOP|nr:hypothetical protein PR048_003643 [Dryococelus australis]